MADCLDEEGVSRSKRQEERRKDGIEVGKLQRNEGVDGTEVLYFRDVGFKKPFEF